MTETRTEVFVQDVVRDRRGRTVVVVVPENKPLRVGDIFVTCYRIPLTMDDILNERPRHDPTDCAVVALTVTAIDSMRVLIDELPRGVTGALYLAGDGMEHVAAKRHLRTAPTGREDQDSHASENSDATAGTSPKRSLAGTAG